MIESSLFTKLKSKEAKGICILIMFIHHLFAFPERLDNVFNTDFLVRLGQEFGIIVGLYVFISGYGLALKPLSLWDGVERIKKLWFSFCLVFFIFIPIGLWLGVYKFEPKEFFENLFFISSSYNHEWWFFALYVQLIVITTILSLIKDQKVAFVVLCVLLLCSVIIKKFDFGTTFLGLRLYLPVFLLSYITCKYNLFEKADGLVCKVVGYRLIRGVVYFMLALVISKKFGDANFLAFFFWFLGFSCFTFNYLSKVFCYLGKHSVNMWLVHTFYCYYYCKDLFVSRSNPILAFVVLLLLSLMTSIVIEYIKDRLKCLKTYFS